MSNGHMKQWVKVLITIIGTFIVVGVAYGVLITEVEHNTTAIEDNGNKIDKMDERLRNEEVKSGNIETNIEWILIILEREFEE